MDELSTAVQRVASTLALDAAAGDAVAALEAAGIGSVLLKGPVTARRLYDDPAARAYADIDLAVAPDSFHDAERVIESLGYTDTSTVEDAAHKGLLPESSWRRGASEIDLHRGFHAVADWDAWWEVLDATAESWLLAGRAVRVPDPAGTALIVALHDTAARRGPQSAEDMRRALDRLSDDVWAEALRRAELVGARSAFVMSLGRFPRGEEWLRRHRVEVVLSPAAAARADGELGAVETVARRKDRAIMVLDELARAGTWRERLAVASALVRGRPLSARRAVWLVSISPQVLLDVLKAWWRARRSGWRSGK